jgi:hypothetical protein
MIVKDDARFYTGHHLLYRHAIFNKCFWVFATLKNAALNFLHNLNY